MPELPPAVWAAIVTVVGVAMGLAAKLGPDRATAASQLTTASVGLIHELQEHNVLLRDEVGALRAENAKLRGEVSDLRVQVDRLEQTISRFTGDSGSTA